MEFKYFSFQAWKAMEFNRWSWKVMKNYSIFGMQINANYCRLKQGQNEILASYV